MLGFLFLVVGVWWMVRAFLERAISPLWWLGLISGILMTALAFWTSGQFFIEKAYVLLVFAGIWALMQGIDEHRARVRDSRRARRAVEEAGSERGRPAARLPPPRVVPQARGAHMSDFKHEDEERLSRRQAAERLVDIAYALTAGEPLELNAAGRRITVPMRR